MLLSLRSEGELTESVTHTHAHTHTQGRHLGGGDWGSLDLKVLQFTRASTKLTIQSNPFCRHFHRENMGAIYCSADLYSLSDCLD